MYIEEIMLYVMSGLFGLVFGSFLNVLILRIPRGEEFVLTPSHCMSCGHPLKWTDLVPFFSYVFLRGRCRYCKAKISVQYPVIELLNAALWVISMLVCGLTLYGLLVCLMSSALLALAVIDWRTYEIPLGFNIWILLLGVARIALQPELLLSGIAGFLAVSLPLAAIFYISHGKAIGGGDVKLMAAAGLFLGWKNILLALILGCILGSVIHILRMRLAGAGRVLAMGPYLAAGILVSAWFGDAWIAWYISLL